MSLRFTDAALVPHVAAFLMEPATEVETVLMRELDAALGRAGFDALPEGAFIEWGCVEHDLIHIYVDTYYQWIEVDRAGKVQTL